MLQIIGAWAPVVGVQYLEEARDIVCLYDDAPGRNDALSRLCLQQRDRRGDQDQRPHQASSVVRVRSRRQGHAEFPEREPYLYTSQFNIQGRLDPLTDNSHLSTASSLSPSREAVDETKIIKGVSR